MACRKNSILYVVMPKHHILISNTLPPYKLNRRHFKCLAFVTTQLTEHNYIPKINQYTQPIQNKNHRDN